MELATPASRVGENPASARSKRRVWIEIAVAYGLILAVIWTPRPWQRFLWIVAAAAVVGLTSISFEGWKAMGLRAANFGRSLWIAGVALAVAGVALLIAASMHTLHVPDRSAGIHRNLLRYAIWTGVQQFLLQGFFLLRFLRVIPNATARGADGICAFRVGALAQSCARADHVALGICGVPAVSSLPQFVSADDRACHPRHHPRHDCSGTGGPQHARWPWVPDLQRAPAFAQDAPANAAIATRWCRLLHASRLTHTRDALAAMPAHRRFRLVRQESRSAS